MKAKEKTRYRWQNGLSNKFGRLTDGLPGKVKLGTNNIHFIACNNILVRFTVIYSRIVDGVLPQKEDTISVRLTIG